MTNTPTPSSPKSPNPLPIPLPPNRNTPPLLLQNAPLHPAPSILSSPPSNSSSDPQQPNQPPAYVTSATGTSATPDQILTSCIALQEHLRKMEEDARRTLREWEDRRQREDLAEKRRVAPGWLDSGVHIIKPEEDGGGTGPRVGIQVKASNRRV
ncbi:hypothetical protein CFE70_006340 [Pyrenophora teres f. teres 0-1]